MILDQVTGSTKKNGKIIVPHTLENFVQCRHLGIDIGHPIMYHYKWSGAYTPGHHQKVSAAYLTYWKKAICANSIGLGKTLTALWAAHYLKQQGYIRKILVVCPLRAAQEVWTTELFVHLTHLTWTVVHGTREQRAKKLAEDVDVYIVNHDGMEIIHDQLMKRDDIDLTIYDEAAKLRNRGKKYKQFRTWTTLKQIPYVWLMTATPTPNNPTDAWALARCIDSPHLACTAREFHDLTMQRIGPMKWVPRPDAQVHVDNIMFPCIRFSREQCFDMPPTTYVHHECEMGAQQKAAYDRMENELIFEAEEGMVDAVNGAAKLNKLFQITCGFIYDTENASYYEIDAAPKLALLQEILDETSEKVILYVPFIQGLSLVSKHLDKKKVPHVTVSGKVRNSAELFSRFKFDPKVRVLLAQPDCMAEALNFSMADIVIWFAPTLKNLIYEQANGRITREEQQRKKVIYHLACSKVEKEQYKNLERKKNFQSLVNYLVQLRSAA